MTIIFVGMIELSPGSRKVDFPHLMGWTSKSGFVKESTTSHVDTYWYWTHPKSRLLAPDFSLGNFGVLVVGFSSWVFADEHIWFPGSTNMHRTQTPVSKLMSCDGKSHKQFEISYPHTLQICVLGSLCNVQDLSSPKSIRQTHCVDLSSHRGQIITKVLASHIVVMIRTDALQHVVHI